MIKSYQTKAPNREGILKEFGRAGAEGANLEIMKRWMGCGIIINAFILST